ncbi:unnamed protein product [marine sediment metagenome]|uniref:Cytidyltransferase-like domain-containing protein n=1 Tax=marine sediment metagenome TaxID=412755 RepID=X1M8E9_9ZZZZ
MRNAKAMAGENGVSVVGILTDEAVKERKQRPILSFDERIELAGAIKYNDLVVPQDAYSPLPNLKRIKPDVAIESASHRAEDIQRVRRYMESIKGRLVVVPYYPSQSSTKIKGKIKKG